MLYKSMTILIGLFFMMACKKEGIQHQEQTPPPAQEASIVPTIDTFVISLNHWSPLSGGKYRSIINLPSYIADSNVSTYLLNVFLDNGGQYQPITGNPIEYMEGELWFERNPEANIMYFESFSNGLPFSVIDDVVLVVTLYPQ
jgi:hypothetical protein